MKEPTTRVSLTRAELLHLADFAASVDDIDNDAFWEHLTNKLESAISRIDGTEFKPTKRTVQPGEADQCPAKCRACGWEGTLTKTGPCPTCGAKVNPLLFYVRPSR